MYLLKEQAKGYLLGFYFFLILCCGFYLFTMELQAEDYLLDVLEAEEGLGHEVSIERDVEGYIGSGYAEFNHTTGSSITWTVNAEESSKYVATFRYGLQYGEKKMDLKVNGVLQKSDLKFPSTIVTSKGSKDVLVKRDAFVGDGAYERKNFGDEEELVVLSGDNGLNRKSFLLFDYSYKYTNQEVSEVRIRLHVKETGTEPIRTIKVYGMSNESWDEDDITWKNQPKNGTYITSFDVSNVADKWYEIDVTSYMKNHLWDKKATFMLVNDSDAGYESLVRFHSKEVRDRGPRMVVTDTYGYGWDLKSVEINLNQGINTIELETKGDGGPSLDNMSLLEGAVSLSEEQWKGVEERYLLAQIGLLDKRELDDEVTQRLNTMKDSSTDIPYLWYFTNASNTYHLTQHAKRFNDMARAYYWEGSIYYENQQLKDKLVEGMYWFYDNMYNEYITSTFENWNDWAWNANHRMLNVLILMGDDLPLDLREKYLRTTRHFMMNIDSILVENGSDPGNATSFAAVQAQYALLTRDSGILYITSKNIAEFLQYKSLSEPKETNGFFEDGTYIAHKSIPYTLGYNGLDGFIRFINIVSDTPAQFDEDKQAIMYEWFFNHYEPWMHRGESVNGVSGRGTSSKKGDTITKSIALWASYAEGENAMYLKQWVKTQLQQRTFWPWDRENIFYANIMNDPTIELLPFESKSKMVPRMARIYHIKPTYSFYVEMINPYVRTYETSTNTNLTGWFKSNGQTLIYNDDSGYYSSKYWITVDPKRHPGITLDPKNYEAKPYTNEIMNKHTWNGGTSMHNEFTIGGMEIMQKNADIYAKKSWFALDDEIVCLGSDIQSTSGRNIETVVDNRKI